MQVNDAECSNDVNSVTSNDTLCYTHLLPDNEKLGSDFSVCVFMFVV